MTMSEFRIELLPAAQGDCIVVEWKDRRRTYRMLVDGGPRFTYPALHRRIRGLRKRRLDLVVVTHVDGDHVEGIARLLQDRAALRLDIGDLWFNGLRHLPEVRSDGLGPEQGEYVTALIERDGLPWNAGFKKAVAVPAKGPLPVVDLPGGPTLTLLSPGPDELVALRRTWLAALRRARMQPGDTEESLRRLNDRPDLGGLGGDALGGHDLDHSEANGSSIAFLLEHRGSSLLLTGDGHGPVLAAGLRRLLADRGLDRLPVDAVKTPHHGSAANVTDDFLSLVDSSRFLFSTNGSTYRHPDNVAVRRVLRSRTGPVELFFNYRSATTEPWAEPPRPHTAVFPAGSDALTLEV
jgi:beta-lactamase superfamily II metal-dependent hydrolase